jgi:urease accessory protein
MAAVEAYVAAPGAWHGALTLRFASAPGKTVVAHRRHEGPFCIQQPFYPGDGVCHVYLLHPPGGLAGGDRLILDTRIDDAASVLLTTPASTKFYRSDGAPSVQRQTLRVAAGASLEWLPLDAILFGGSRADIATDVQLHPAAKFIGWEMTALGRPLSGDRYSTGALEQRTRIYIGDEPQVDERLCWRVGDPILRAEWGLAGFGVLGALYAYPADARLLALARERLCAHPHPPQEQRAAATLLGRLLAVRYLGNRPEPLRTQFEDLWAAIRTAVVAREPSAPRIWKT